MISLTPRRSRPEEDNPYHGDTEAAVMMHGAIEEFFNVATKALTKVKSSDGEDALTNLVDNALPAVQVWLGKCKEHGVL